MKSIHLVGDSISMHYTQSLMEFLTNSCIFSRKEGEEGFKNLDVPKGQNGGDSSMVLTYLSEFLANTKIHIDHIVLNCGLHDIKKDNETGKLQVSEENYKKNLNNLFQLIRQNKIEPIWITTTHFNEVVHNQISNAFKRLETDSHKYHEIALEVTRNQKVPLIDLRAFTLKIKSDLYIDHVHFNTNIRPLQAAYIAGALSHLLKN